MTPNRISTKIQITAGGAARISLKPGEKVADDFLANLLLLAHASTMAAQMETGAATDVNQSYLPAIQKRTLFAKNSATRLKKNRSHFTIRLVLQSHSTWVSTVVCPPDVVVTVINQQ